MIGMVLVTHGRLATEFRAALEHVVGPQTQIETVTIGPDDDMERRRKDIIEAFEVLVEGKDPIVEEIVEEFTVAKATPSVTKPRIDYDKLLRNLDAVERLWNAYIDMDDEEILLLL